MMISVPRLLFGLVVPTPRAFVLLFFFFNDTATTEIYTLSLHDALPISARPRCGLACRPSMTSGRPGKPRSEEHTSELQSRVELVCRLLLEKKKNVHYIQESEWKSTVHFIKYIENKRQ